MLGRPTDRRDPTVFLADLVHYDSIAPNHLLTPETAYDDVEFCPSSEENLDPKYDAPEYCCLSVAQLATHTQASDM